MAPKGTREAIPMELIIKDGKKEKTITLEDDDVLKFIDDNWDNIEDRFRTMMKIGVNVLQTSQTSVDTNYVDKEFQRLKTTFDKRIEGFQKEWEEKVRKIFGEDFCKLQESIDPDDPESPTGKLIEEMEDKLSEVISEMDPEEEDSPLGRLKSSLERKINNILVEMGKTEGREEEAVKGTGKGTTYEEDIEIALNDIVAPFNDVVYPTGAKPGPSGSKKGDVVVELDGSAGRKVVLEVKRKRLNLTAKFYDEEIKEAMANRGAQASILVVHPEHADVLGRPLRLWKSSTVACVYDPETGDTTALEVAYQLARNIALSKDQTGGKIDLFTFRDKLDYINGRVEQITNIEKAMTKSLNSLGESKEALNKLKKEVLEELTELLDNIGNGEEE